MDNYHSVIALAASNKPMHFHFLKREAEREGQEAFEAGAAPEVVLEATHESALEFIDLANLKQHAC